MCLRQPNKKQQPRIMRLKTLFKPLLDHHDRGISPDTVVQLTFVFLRVTFRGSPFLRSSHVLTKDEDTANSARPIN